MSQTVIPREFERYLQNKISVGEAPDMNEMIFAHIPNLDPSQPINRDNGLPDVSLWVHQQDIDQVGKLGDNALAYSVVILNSEPEFTFNAIYLRDKNVVSSCGMVVHKAEETKELGMASTKSLLMEYVGAAQIAGITVDASTWQIDYQARLKGIEEDHRLACLDNYGHTAFVDGFDVTQQADPDKYLIAPGVVYIGGLRTVLDGEVLRTITTKPNGVYLDVVRDGTALSKWQNHLTITVSEQPVTDYLDAQGRQHYVARLAGINADGSVEDWRETGGLAAHLSASDPHKQYELQSNAASDAEIDTESSLKKHVKLPQLWRALRTKIKEASLTVKGIVQLSNSYQGTSEKKAVTEKALTQGLATKSPSRHILYYYYGDGSADTNSQLFDRVERVGTGQYKVWFTENIEKYHALIGCGSHDFNLGVFQKTNQYVLLYSLHSSNNAHYDQSFDVEVIL